MGGATDREISGTMVVRTRASVSMITPGRTSAQRCEWTCFTHT